MTDEPEDEVTLEGDPEQQVMEFSDRYGGQYPDPDTVCPGPCEGLGVYPAYSAEADRHRGEPSRVTSADHTGDDTEAIREQGAHPDPEGWAFIRCPDCFGTGKRRDLITMQDLLKLWQPREPAEGEKRAE